jgi:hypothetical protein
MAAPEDRLFDFDVIAEAIENRPQLVADALTVLRGYHNADKVPLAPFGSFEQWDIVRGSLVWLGMPDPAQTRSLAKSDDPEREDRLVLVEALWRLFRADKRFTVNALSALQHTDEVKAIIGLFWDGGWNQKRIGHLLTKNLDIPVQGVIIRSAPPSGSRQYWLEGVPTPPFVSEPPPM